MCTCSDYGMCERCGGKNGKSKKKAVDWTKPIRMLKGCCESPLKVEAISRTGAQACLRCAHGKIWLFSRDGHCVEAGSHGVSLKIENIPEPKVEKWYRIYLGPTGQAYSFGEYGSMELANAAHMKADLGMQYLGAVLLRDKL